MAPRSPKGWKGINNFASTEHRPDYLIASERERGRGSKIS
jgi:hypothetical protein